MAIADDFSITRSNGNIRHVSGSTVYAVIDFHRYLADKGDDSASAGDDEYDVTDLNASDRSTDQIITLENSFNIDADASEYLKNGSISQNSGDDIFGGLKIVGALASSTSIKIAQDGSFLTQFWGASSGAGTLLEIILQYRSSGVDIDSGNIQLVADNLSNSFASFDVTLGLGESVGSLSTSTDSAWNNSNSGDPLSLSEFSDLDELYDGLKQWKTLSLANFNYPTNAGLLGVAQGSTLDLGSLDLVVDATAGTLLDVNTGSGIVTIKATTLAAGSTFGKVLTSGTITTANGAIVSSGQEDSTGVATAITVLNLTSSYIYLEDNVGTQQDYQSLVTGTYNFAAPLGSTGTWKLVVDRQGYTRKTFTFTADGVDKEFDGSLTQLLDLNGIAIYQGQSASDVTVVGASSLVDVKDSVLTGSVIYDMVQDYSVTAAGMDDTSVGNVTYFTTDNGNYLGLGTWQIRRDATATSLPTINAIVSQDSGTPLDETNGQVAIQFTGGGLSDTAKQDIRDAMAQDLTIGVTPTSGSIDANLDLTLIHARNAANNTQI